jgi:putative membrane protein insertion efficiency factor
MIAAVRCYQAMLRPITVGSCRYLPGCSEYCIEALRLHGPWRGTVLGLKRILRCRPGGGWGYDPVPPARSAPAPAGGPEGETIDPTPKRIAE